MCKVGGPRCDGSHKPSAAQRARRKANTAYRNAVADAVLNTTGDDDLARRVKHASMTDLHDIVAAGGYDAEAIAKKCGTATYTSPDGETATVDVVPAGNTRRTPISDETKELLEDIDDAMGSLPGGFYREAVLEGDREGAENMAATADVTIAGALDRAATMDFDTATDAEVSEALNHLSNLDDLSMSMRGRGFEFSEDDGSYQAWKRVMDEHTRRVGGGSNFLEDLGHEPDDINDESAGDIADSLDELIREYDVHSMSEAEFQKTYDRAKATSELLREHGHGDNAAMRLLDAEKDRRALSAEERDKVANYGYGEVTPDNAPLIGVAANDELLHADLEHMSEDDLEKFYNKFERIDRELQDAGYEHGVYDMYLLDAEREEREKAEYDPTVYDNGYLDVDGIASGTITVTPDNADEVADKITDEVSSTDVSGLSDDEFDEFYDRMDTLDDKLRAAGHDGVYELANLAEERDYRNQNEDDKYEFGDAYRRSNQLQNWAYDIARDHKPDDVEWGMWRAAQYLENDEFYTGADVEGTKWADDVLANKDAYGEFEVGVAQNVADKRDWKDIKSNIGDTDVTTLSMSDVTDYERRLNDLTNRLRNDDSPLLSTDYEADRAISDLHQRLLEEKLAREERAYERESKRERARFNADKEEAAAGESMESKAEKFWREREERLAREAAERKARGGAGMGGSTFAFEGGPSGNFNADGSANVTNMGAGNDDTPEARRAAEQAVNEKFGTGSGAGASDTAEEQPEGKTWSVGTVVWAPTKGDVFARVVSMTDKTVTLEEMETSWDAPSGGRQKYSPGAPTGRTYRRQIQRNAAGDMTCKAGPSKSSAMMVEWG